MADEIFVFGAVYINAAPESYLQFARNVNRLRSVPGFLAIGEFSDPPQLSDLKALTLDGEDIKELKECKPARLRSSGVLGGRFTVTHVTFQSEPFHSVQSAEGAQTTQQR